MLNSLKFLEHLKNMNYDFQIHEHQPLFTVEESKSFRGQIKGSHTKNLFLKNKKNKFFLISCDEMEIINLKKISKSLELGNVSFAKEQHLNEHLGIKPGSISPFALINDIQNNVDFYFENKLYESEYINFHPLINTITVTIKTNKFMEFMIENNKKIHIFSSREEKILQIYGR